MAAWIEHYQHQSRFRIARGVEERAVTVRVTVTGSAGRGDGEASPLLRYEQDPEACRASLDLLDGALTDDPSLLLAALDKRWRPGCGLPAARAALESACLDYVARARSLPVYKLLGLARPVASTSMTISLGSPTEMAQAAAEVDPQFRSLKIKLGGRDGLDLDRLRTVRDATDRPLIVDVNEHWTLHDALEIAPKLADFNVIFLEQPLVAGHTRMAAVRDAASVPVVADEAFTRVEDLDYLAEMFDGVNVKVAKLGGIRVAVEAARQAADRGLAVVLGCMNESQLGISAALQLASLAGTWDLDGHLLLHAPWRGLELADGALSPGSESGLGVWLQEGLIAQVANPS